MIPKTTSSRLQRLAGHLAAAVVTAVMAGNATALALAPDEFQASRQLACILAQQSLGQLSEQEYGELTHSVLDDFDEAEQDAILAKALGYYDGLMFSIPGDDAVEVNLRLEDFVSSPTCSSGYRKVTYTL
jgi:hypothetical protein